MRGNGFYCRSLIQLQREEETVVAISKMLANRTFVKVDVPFQSFLEIQILEQHNVVVESSTGKVGLTRR